MANKQKPRNYWPTASKHKRTTHMTCYQVYERFCGVLTGKKPKRRHFNFEVHLIDSCNLNRKDCFHFAPLANDDGIYPLDEFEKEIQRLSKVFNGSFGWTHLLGGEPLLNKDTVLSHGCDFALFDGKDTSLTAINLGFYDSLTKSALTI